MNKFFFALLFFFLSLNAHAAAVVWSLGSLTSGSCSGVCAQVWPASTGVGSCTQTSSTGGQCFIDGQPSSAFPRASAPSCPFGSVATPAGACKPGYRGSNALSVCTPDGVCNGTLFPDLNSACQSYGSGPVGLNLNGGHLDTLSGTSCTVTQCFSNGTCNKTVVDLTTGIPGTTSAPFPPPGTPPASGVPPTTPAASGVPSTPPASGVPGTGTGTGTTPGTGTGTGTGSGTGTGTTPGTGTGTGTPAASGVPPTPDPCTVNPGLLSCATLGTAPAAETIPTLAPDFTASLVPFSGATGCPAPFTFTLSMPGIAGTYSISVQPLCDLAVLVRPIFIAIATITSLFIFVGVVI